MVDITRGRLPGELLTSVSGRISFLYLEYGRVMRESNSLIFRSGQEDIDIPAAQLTALILGHGVSVTQEAIAEISRLGCNISFVYSGALGVHASFVSGRSRSANLLARQALLSSTAPWRLKVAVSMYSKRWDMPVEELAGMSIKSMMGKEVYRMKTLYREYAEQYGIALPLVRNRKHFDSLDPINQAITSLY